MSPAELTSNAAAHIRFEPRTWPAGRRLRSTSTAALRPVSATAAAMISLRLCGLTSLHRLAMTSLLPRAATRWPVLYIGPIAAPGGSAAHDRGKLCVPYAKKSPQAMNRPHRPTLPGPVTLGPAQQGVLHQVLGARGRADD